MPDIFHIDQNKSLTDDQKSAVLNIKRSAQELMAKMKLPYTVDDRVKAQAAERCINISHTKLEEAVMWAVKGITSI